MPIHAGPYIVRSILDQKYWAAQFRKDADEMDAKAAEKRAAAVECEKKAARLAEGTDFDPTAHRS